MLHLFSRDKLVWSRVFTTASSRPTETEAIIYLETPTKFKYANSARPLLLETSPSDNPAWTRTLCGELSEVAGQLETDADVVFHATNLATHCNGILLKGGGSPFELIRVHLHLLPKAYAHAYRVSREEGLPHVDSFLLKHEHHELTHCMLDRVGGEDPNAVVLRILVERAVGDPIKGPLVVFRLES